MSKADEIKADIVRRGKEAIAQLQLSEADASLVEYVIARQAEMLVIEAAGGDTGEGKKVMDAVLGNLKVAAQLKAANAINSAFSGLLVTLVRGLLVPAR